jgi:hypothetical protein
MRKILDFLRKTNLAKRPATTGCALDFGQIRAKITSLDEKITTVRIYRCMGLLSEKRVHSFEQDFLDEGVS